MKLLVLELILAATVVGSLTTKSPWKASVRQLSSNAMPQNFGLQNNTNGNMGWEDIVKRKRAERDALLPQEWKLKAPPNTTAFSPLNQVINSGLLSSEELEWTDTKKYDATTMLQRLSSGEITAEKLVTAFCKRATAATSLANFLTEVNIADAINRAKELDRILNETGKTVGPLHGLPMTIKDTEDLKGFDTSCGITGWAFDPRESNGPLIQILIDAGAVIIGKTNIPQTVLAADSDSIVWGRTLNAHRNTFGAGGSTGGEGSALGTGSTLLGVASDGAGSSRMPAMANGVVGYRPSGYRLPPGGREVFTDGRSGLSMTGPVAGMGLMGHSVRDIRLAAKVVSDAKPWEAQTPFMYPSPWMNITAPEKPRIGVWNVESPNTYLHLFPPVLRGYQTAQSRLRAAGFELVEFTPPDMSQVWDLCKEFLIFQGIETLTEMISREPITKIVRDTGIFVPDTPRFPVSVDTLYQLNTRLVNLTVAMDTAWNSSGRPLDALLSVTAANTALPWDTWHDTTYTSIYNSVDWPAISLPLGLTVDKNIDHKYSDFRPFSREDARLEALYNPETFHGLPLSVQLAGRKFEDEKLLAIAELLHPVMKGE